MNNNKNLLIGGLVAVALIAVVAGIALSGGSGGANTETSAAPSTSTADADSGSAAAESDPGADREEAPNVSGEDVANPNKTVALEDFRGKPVVVQVWASWCSVCNEEAPGIAEFQKDNPEVEFVGVNVEDTQDNAAAFKQNYGLTHKYDISDPNREVAGQLGFTGQPNSMVIDKQGRVVAVFPGAVSKEQLEDAIGQI